MGDLGSAFFLAVCLYYVLKKYIDFGGSRV
jgi:hypothetical protein